MPFQRLTFNWESVSTSLEIVAALLVTGVEGDRGQNQKGRQRREAAS
jgi:hypothetical protein